MEPATTKRLILFAYSDLGYACLKFLLDRGEPVLTVYTHDDSPGEKIWFPSVKELATAHHVPTRTPDKIGDVEINHIRSLRPDLLLSFYYRFMIPAQVLEIPALGAYNMHGSFLPKFRGRAPVNWAVLKGERETGATLHVMVAKADAGDIIDQEAVPIEIDDTSIEVQGRVTQAAVKIISRQIENLKTGKAPRRPQNNSESSYYGRRQPEDGRIDWNQPAEDIHNLIRAVTHPFPGAFTDIFGKKTYIWRSRIAPIVSQISLQPGMFQLDHGRLLIGCGDNRQLELLRVQIDGMPEQNGADLALSLIK